jgi:hypothetical protein
MIQKLINELQRISRIQDAIQRIKELENFVNKFCPEMVKKEKQEIMNKLK